MEKRVKVILDLRESTRDWLADFGKKRGRAMMRQGEQIIEDKRKRDERN